MFLENVYIHTVMIKVALKEMCNVDRKKKNPDFHLSTLKGV